MYDKNPTSYIMSDFFMCKNLRSCLIRKTHITIKKSPNTNCIRTLFVFGDRNYWHPVTMRFPVCFKKFF